MSADHYDEGHTIAGWTGTFIATIGAAVVGVGICGWRPGIWLGIAVMVVALLVTWALHLAGWGKRPGPRPADQWSMRVRDHAARAGHEECLGCLLAGRRGTAARPTGLPDREQVVTERRSGALTP
ncbi:HGxxPAAW family protein [Streptomyces sp. NPDC127084]|uniref:HGxxPAAW family protein n=1 Tax=Streptomyces sp. NPDC127084 TaxID=3347133 RepID=UPI0036572C4A